MTNYFEDKTIYQDTIKEFEAAEFVNCRFQKIDFTNASFRESKFYESHFQNCNLSNLNMKSTSWREVKFSNCKLIGINWSDCQSIAEIIFEHSILDYSVFHDLNLYALSMINCSLKYLDISNLKMKKSRFIGSDLLGASISNCDLSECDFTSAMNYSISPESNKLSGATFSMPEAMSLLSYLGVKIV